MWPSTHFRIPGPSLSRKKIERTRNESWIAAAASDEIPLTIPWISVSVPPGARAIPSVVPVAPEELIPRSSSQCCALGAAASACALIAST